MEKAILILGLVICSLIVYPQQIIVFSKEEKCFLDSKSSPCMPEEADKLEFLDYFKNLTFQDTLKIIKANLITPPLEWGKKVSDSTYGEIIYYTSLPYGFFTNIGLFNLIPDHSYLLTINGNPKLAGNNLLPDTVPNFSIEKYYDFLSIKTDLHGEYQAQIGVYLKHGDYHVRFYVKDTDGYKIVLYHDYFKFTVNRFEIIK